MIIDGISQIARDLGIFTKVKSTLIKQPDPAAKYLADVLNELSKTYSAIDGEISSYLGIWFNENDLKGIQEQRRALINLEGGKVNVRMAEARGHCSKIKSIYEKFLNPWFKRILQDDEYREIYDLFKNLYDWDQILIQTLDSLAQWLQINAQMVLDYVSKGELIEANEKIEQDREQIRPDRLDLSEIMKILYELQAILIETSKAL